MYNNHHYQFTIDLVGLLIGEGCCITRRHAERLIQAGQVVLEGEIVSSPLAKVYSYAPYLSLQVAGKDKGRVHGHEKGKSYLPSPLWPEMQYLAYEVVEDEKPSTIQEKLKLLETLAMPPLYKLAFLQGAQWVLDGMRKKALVELTQLLPSELMAQYAQPIEEAPGESPGRGASPAAGDPKGHPGDGDLGGSE